MNIGYARETPGGLTLEEQTTRLEAEGCGYVYRETDWKKRTGLWRAVQACGRGDTLVIVNLVRAALSNRELFELWAKLKERGAGLRPLTEKWADPQHADGRGLEAMLEGLAAFEAEAMADKMRLMRAVGEAKGRMRGRQSKLTPEAVAEILAEYKPGVTLLGDLAARHKVHSSTISRIVNPPNRKTT